MNEGRQKGRLDGARAWCGRCGFLRVVDSGDSTRIELTLEEQAKFDRGEGEVWESVSPPGPGDLCPRCMGDAWCYPRD